MSKTINKNIGAEKRLTEFCSWITIDAIKGLVKSDNDDLRTTFSHYLDLSMSEHLMKRSLVAFFLVALAATEFLQDVIKFREKYNNPLPDLDREVNLTNSDVLVAEAMIYAWAVIHRLAFNDLREKAKKYDETKQTMTVREFRALVAAAPTEEDEEAIQHSLLILCGIVKRTTGWNVRPLVQLRVKKYSEPSGKDQVDEFIGVMQCAVLKNSIIDPDRITSLDLNTSLIVRIVAYSTAQRTFPAYYETYKNIANVLPGAGAEATAEKPKMEGATHPAEVLVRQAATMNWQKEAVIERDGDPVAWAKRSVRFKRKDEEAVVWYEDATVTLVRVHVPPTFKNFVELERWLSEHPHTSDDEETNEEILYLREIEKYVIRMGYFEEMLETQATDKLFYFACIKLHKAGYQAGEDAVVIAALTLEALMRYSKSRDASLRFLAGLEKDTRTAKPASSRMPSREICKLILTSSKKLATTKDEMLALLTTWNDMRKTKDFDLPIKILKETTEFSDFVAKMQEGASQDNQEASETKC